MASTLLLADDSVTIQRVIELTFANEDVEVVATYDGEAAIRRIDADPPDIVLADVAMPKVDGYAVAGHVKRSARLRHIPVLLLAGAFDPVDEEKARASGCDGILVKPFEPQQLVARVGELLSRQRMPTARADSPVVNFPGPKLDGPALTLVPAAAPTRPESTELPPAGPSDMERTFQREFDELVAFVDLEPEPEAAALTEDLHLFRSSGSEDDQPFGGWDLPAPADSRSSTVPATPPAETGASNAPPPAPAVTARPVERTPPGAIPKSSMASAFAALLAAEQAHPASAAAARSPIAISEASVEEIVRRVLRRMADDAVRRIVLETAERLIHEEIEKMKSGTE